MKSAFRTFCCALALILAVALAAPSGALAADTEMRRVAIHIDENDPARMNMALNNAANVQKYYEAQGIEVEVRVVAYGPGLMMLRKDKSPVADRIAQMSLASDNISFAACGNTHRAMSAKEGADVQLLEEASLVPSGVVEKIELQRQGWSYIRP